MKTTLLTLLIVLTANLNVTAQKLIAVQNGGTPTFYSSLNDAVTNAQNKDTLYIPGAAFTIPNNTLTINKELHLIGVGHHPDSTYVTGITQINATIKLVAGANNSSFEGFKLSGDFYTGTSNLDEDVDNITISRCNVGNLHLSRLSTNWAVYENIIRGSIQGYSITSLTSTPSASNNSFLNNIIETSILSFSSNNEFKNNFFMYYNTTIVLFNELDGCLFQNNIFRTSSNIYVTSCIFDNNLFFSPFSISVGSTSTGSNNITYQTATDTFVNAATTGDFSYTDDYHLKGTSSGKNAGYDGTDIGIYGGVFPWKVGSIPSNPHFQTATIAPKTDNAGLLNVNIKVSAQDN